MPARATADFLPGFEARYRAVTRPPADDLARRAHVAARLIDRRAAQGGVDDSSALAAAVRGY